MASNSNLLQLQAGAKSFGGQSLFTEATFSINEGEHVGVIGPNGAGKSTLFRILMDEESLDTGQVIRSRSLRVGYLSQHDHWKDGETGDQYLERASILPLWQVKSMGRDLQVSDDVFCKPITSLSGGYRMRIKLLGLLGQDPNLMLLDEPTNYLDLETTLLLEKFLQNFEGAFLLISHDREFLRRTTDHILEVEAGDITKYNGNIDDYFEQKELLKSQLEAQARSQADKRKAVLEFVSRFGAKATKAKQAQSRLKRLEKMEVIETKAAPVTARIRIPEPPHVGRSVLRLSRAELGYPEKTVLKNVNVEIQRGDHVAVVGVNGAGKSTLLKALAGTLRPLTGDREVGYQVETAIFNQHVVEVLNPGLTVFESLEDAADPSVSRQDVLDMAGSLLFSNDNVRKKVSVLSGGEKSRVALGQILLRKVPCLLLDEPTNHLDFQTVEALTQALHSFGGTVIAVSHDRGFIRRMATKILEVNRGGVHLYPGTYDEYVWRLQKELASPLAEDDPEVFSSPAPAPPISESPVLYQNKKDRDKKLRVLEREINKCEEDHGRMEEIAVRLNEKIAGAGADTQDLVRELGENALRLAELEKRWLQLCAEREALKMP